MPRSDISTSSASREQSPTARSAAASSAIPASAMWGES
jgi:hypothetical protein